MPELQNRVSKQELHFMAIIIFITLENFTLRTFGLFPPEATGRLLLARLCLITWKKELNHAAISKRTRSIGKG